MDTVFDISGDFIMISADVIEKMEREKAYKAREAHRKAKKRAESGAIPFANREFIAWDGEGYDDRKRRHHYMLLANSKDMSISGESLGTEQCLDLILQTSLEFPYRIHVFFGGNYDVSMILNDLPPRFFRILKMFGKVTWRQYTIEHIPRKWFTVMAYGLTVKIFDIQSFFASSFEAALTKWKIGPWKSEIPISRIRRMPSLESMRRMSEPEIIAIFKRLRGKFSYSKLGQVAYYNQIELKYLVILAENLREVFTDAGFNVRSWHGPGALARTALNINHVKSAMAITPPDIRIAARYAFAGGRFEMVRGGLIEGKVYNADINSAYPAFAALLPNLNRGSWRFTRHYEPDKFAVYRIRYTSKPNLLELFPLFRRDRSGNVEWPNRVEGWYWNPEAELVKDDPCAEFIEGWVFDEWDNEDRPFYWIREYYRKRQFLKSIGNPAEFTFKLCINSVYGQLAQRTGWNQKTRKPPPYHQLEWAGWITSKCRAEIYKVAKACGQSLISVDTDGLYSLSPIPVSDIGDDLGMWDITEYDGGIFWQSGMYALRTGKTWIKAKTRGIPKGSYSPDLLIQAFKEGSSLKVKKKSFVGYGLALNGRWNERNTWKEEPHEFIFGGKGKRAHNEIACRNGVSCDNRSHGFIPVPHRTRPDETISSYPHWLPWLDNPQDMTDRKLVHFDMILYDRNDIDDDDAMILKNLEKVG